MRAHEASYSARRQLENRWDETRQLWRDSAADHFATYFWEPLERETERFLRELERLMQTLEVAQRIASE